MFFDPTVRACVKQTYQELLPRLEALEKKGGRYAYLYGNMANLCRALSLKYDLGVRTRERYRSGDRKEVAALVPIYEETAKAVEAFALSYETMWYRENKPNGLEVHQQRLGGLIFRIRSLASRLAAYGRGEIDALPELEELLPYWESSKPASEETSLPHVNSWKKTVTVNRI